MDYDLSSLLHDSFASFANQMFTAIPCVIAEIPENLTDLRIHVKPVVNRKYKDGTSEEMDTMYNVPVLMQGSSTSMVSFPLHIGDNVLCVFSQRSIESFKAGDGLPSTPRDFRKFSQLDAMAIPGLYPFAKSINNPAVRKWEHNTQDLVVSHNIGQALETEIRILNSGGVVINTDQDVITNCKNSVVNCQNSQVNADTGVVNIPSTTWNGDINHTGVFSNTGSLSSNGKVLDTHTHAGSPPPD